MKSVRVKVHALLVCAATIALAGCSTSAVPSIAGAPQQLSPRNASNAASSQSLVYLSDASTNEVLVYGYPKGKLVQTLALFGAPRGECADAHGYIWIVDTQALQIEEFAHGGSKPITALSTPGTPVGCSVNPRDGDVAVSGGSKGAVVFVFHYSGHDRWRDAEPHTDKTMRAGAFCGYDAQGNLFVDGRTKNGTFALAELQRGSAQLTDLSINVKINSPGQVQWDGTYLALGDAGVAPSVVYQLSINGSSATQVHKITLDGTKSVRQFWIQRNRIVAPDFRAQVGLWAYPHGGSMIGSFPVAGYGAAVSNAQ
jgi:hypothetical protein